MADRDKTAIESEQKPLSARLKFLSTLLEDAHYLEAISERLDTTLAGAGNYREVVQYYGLDQYTMDTALPGLKRNRLKRYHGGPTTALLEYLSTLCPDLTVQEFAGVVREKAKRRDVDAILEAYMYEAHDSNRLNRVTEAAESKPLNCLLDDPAPLQAISESLDRTLSGFGNYREVAQYYGPTVFREPSILEENDRGPTTALIGWLAVARPKLTVQEFAAAVREKSERRDVAALLKAYDSSRLNINRLTDAVRRFPPIIWIQGESLGAGGFGKVYKCHAGCHGILAVKIVKVEPQNTENQAGVKVLQNEISILQKIKHERIVSYYGSQEKQGQLHLFMDFMPGGSLSGHIKQDGILSESISRRYTRQILEGIYFLHSQNIIHRDIKGSNVLLDGEGNVKLADFGLSKLIQKVGSKTNLVSYCGTPYYMAPEMFRGDGYGRKADIWSLGCTVVEMLTGKPPLGHLEPHQAMFKTGSGPFELTLPESVSQDATEFIKAALTWKPEERPWSEELQRYKFVSKENMATSEGQISMSEESGQ